LETGLANAQKRSAVQKKEKVRGRKQLGALTKRGRAWVPITSTGLAKVYVGMGKKCCFTEGRGSRMGQAP